MNDHPSDLHPAAPGREPRERQCGRDHQRYMVRWEFDPEPDALALVRAALRYRLAEWGITGDDAHGALLVAGELVTNAVEHATSRVDVTVTCSSRSTLRISVRDDSSELPRLRRPGLTTARGRGLQIVAAVAERWGCAPDATGKTVWAEVAPGTAWLGSS